MRALWILFSLLLGEVHGRRFFVDFGFPDFPVQNGPMLRGRSPVEVRAPKYVHAIYKPPKDQLAGEDSFTWVVLGVAITALFGAGSLYNHRRKTNTQSAVMELATADPARPTGGSPRSAPAFPGR
jgi:hypothetical protein